MNTTHSVNGNGTTAQPLGITQTQPALAEAACSVNMFFEIDGIGKGQATGRGRNAKEAAANLKATIDETRAAFAPPAPMAPPSKEARVAALLACGIQKATLKNDWPRIERLAKAAALVLSNAVHQAGLEGHFTVDSRTQAGVWYDTTASSCGCQDYQRHAAGEEAYYCLHILACLMTHRLAEITP